MKTTKETPAEALERIQNGKITRAASSRPWTAAVFHVSQTKAVQS